MPSNKTMGFRTVSPTWEMANKQIRWNRWSELPYIALLNLQDGSLITEGHKMVFYTRLLKTSEIPLQRSLKPKTQLLFKWKTSFLIFFQPVKKPISSTNHTSCSVGPRSYVCHLSLRRANHNSDFLFLQVNYNVHSKTTTWLLPCGNTLHLIAAAINLFRASTNVGFLCNTTTGSNVFEWPKLHEFLCKHTDFA